MRIVRLVLRLLFLYVVADLSSPLIPGAFAFDPDESVEASRLERRSHAVPIAVASSDRSAPATPLPPPSPQIVRTAAGHAHARDHVWRPGTRSAADPAPSLRSEDPLA